MEGVKTDLDKLHTTYRPFVDESNESEEDEAPPNFSTGTRNNTASHSNRVGGAENETPFGNDPGVMIHVVTETGKSKWSHIDDLDSFFIKVYEYHQKHGFYVMMIQEYLELVQFIFIIMFTVFMTECIDYNLLFNNDPEKQGKKVFISEVIVLKGFVEMAFFVKCFILTSVACWITRLIVVVYHGFQFWDVKSFFNTALKISDKDLDSITWWEVQSRLQAAQSEHMMCIHKEELTELDVHHRILRFNNYLVSMINKSLLPLRFSIPVIGDYVFLSSGLKFNLELILFKSPWAPYNQWHLREEYKRVAKRKELADMLQNRILILGCINLILMPLILLWQILYSFFSYAEVIKREPGSLGVRKWGLYGRYYLRHLNELEHELSARLARAYKPASYYMDIFVSPLATVVAKNVTFMCGSVLAVLILLSVWDEDVLNVEHVLTIMTALGAAVAGARVFIPDENLVFCPEKTLTQVISHIHYFPEDWKGNAHTYKVMTEMGLLFPYTAVYLLDELFSPVITPLILIFQLRYKSQDIVDFFRNFTVDVVGVGDVCSFAQMDVRRHGNPGWQAGQTSQQEIQPVAKTNQYTQGEDGKTEMSLVHFTITNPGWKPSIESEKYLTGLRTCAERDVNQLSTLPEQSVHSNPLYDSVSAMSEMGGSYREVALRVLHGGQHVPSPPPHTVPSPPDTQTSEVLHDSSDQHQSLRSPSTQLPQTSQIHRRGGPTMPFYSSQSFSESRLFSPSLMQSRQPIQPSLPSLLHSGLPPPEITGLEYAAADMSMSVLYLHNIQHRNAHKRPSIAGASGYRFQMRNITEGRDQQEPVELEPLIRGLSSEN
ncbi:autophagy-related protein 9A [Eurytemora carolleeae]|uniref:autophagy-related protein 9A n=1 Tax=Eurytemora carolleeae TaxID=1294199 RepID=UPI000C773102|nr:autophagy-related protein 9A [Eurytemora carolleeae]|eukprot:XP_023344796.1 autophagy-related protein 9A-like [Eurytemora affinis]